MQLSRTVSALIAALAVCAATGCSTAPAHAGTTTFALDGNRVYARVGFVRPDGSVYDALAFVDMGSPAMAVTRALFDRLRLDRSPLRFHIGALSLEVPRDRLDPDRASPYAIDGHAVEAVLPAGVLQAYDVVIDYGDQTLSLMPPGTNTFARGVAVPLAVDPNTGLMAVMATIAGKPYWVTIDNGSAYTWFQGSVAERWIAAHPAWRRGVGAVGPSNMTMSGDGTETAGTLLRIPSLALGDLTLRGVGALAAGRGRTFAGGVDLFGWYSRKNVTPVVGWIGGNVLRDFRLTFDYGRRISYWQRVSAAADRLDQVGLTLRYDGKRYFVAAIATKNGRATVRGVQPGDELLGVAALQTKNASWGEIFSALSGAPGARRPLILRRGSQRFTVVAPVTAF